MTTEQILIKWITNKANSKESWFYSYNLEDELPLYGRLAHQKIHSASTYSRAFRKLRANNKLKAMGYMLEEIVNPNKKVKGWKIVKDM
tara:strand:- start:361 stop:624 length:264 start_codon:yes stop_codon:yes gene_type:complete